MSTDRDAQGRFVQGNKASTSHGGEGAVKSIQRSEPLCGLAVDAEQAVADEYETEGRFALVVRNARRLQAACDLYWNAVAKAAGDGDLAALDKYVKRFGWLASSALRAWAQVRNEGDNGQDSVIIDAVAAAREVSEDEHSDAD